MSSIATKMNNAQTENSVLSWFWQDYVSTYRYWGLVLASFLMACTSMSVFSRIYPFLVDHDLPMSSIGFISGFASIGRFFGVLVVVYFFRRRLKIALVLFALITAVSALLLFSGKIMQPAGLVSIMMCLHIGVTGFMIATIAALVGGRPNIGTFVIVYSVVMLWGVVGQILSPLVMALMSERSLEWVAGVPALLAILVLLPMSGKMFLEQPDTVIAAAPATKREPFAIFLLALFIPFYLLFWIFRQPGELKTLAPDMRQPSRAGILCTSIFAPFILPIWYHDVRKELADKLAGRSARVLGVVAFFLPAIAAAMAQSDNNMVANSET